MRKNIAALSLAALLALSPVIARADEAPAAAQATQPVKTEALQATITAVQGLVQVREEGTRNLYSIRMQGFASVREFVDDFWDTALARLEELAK